MTRNLLKAALLCVVFSAQAQVIGKECGHADSGIRLENYHAPAVRIGLPPGSKGPQMEMDTSDYHWGTPLGIVWVKFGVNSHDLHAKKIGTEKVGADEVLLYRWRDYSGHDQLVAEWLPGDSINRRTLVEVPVDWSSCKSIAVAKSIVRSIRFINNPKLLRVEAPAFKAGKWQITVVNELGEKRQVRVGDVVTWDNGVVTAIDAHGMLVRSYDWGKGTWSEMRVDLSLH
jgi:hypothetical protein